MRIAVFGTGGVGGYFGGRLAQAGEDVVFVARGTHLEAMRTQGLRVESIKGNFTITPVQATDDPAQIGIVDVVIVAVKAWQIPDVAQAIRPMIGPQTYVVPLQNGLEAPAQLADVLGSDYVLGGTCAIYSFITEPGCIRHIGLEPSITMGELPQGRSIRAEPLQQALQRASVSTTMATDIQIPMWEKFLVLRWGVIGAVTRAPAEVIRTLPQIRAMVEQACEEVRAVAQARSIRMAADTIERSMAILDSLPPSSTTSMQRDILERRPSELDAQAGALVRLGQQSGVSIPLHMVLYHSLLPMELRARGDLSFPE